MSCHNKSCLCCVNICTKMYVKSTPPKRAPNALMQDLVKYEVLSSPMSFSLLLPQPSYSPSAPLLIASRHLAPFQPSLWNAFCCTEALPLPNPNSNPKLFKLNVSAGVLIPGLAMVYSASLSSVETSDGVPVGVTDP